MQRGRSPFLVILLASVTVSAFGASNESVLHTFDGGTDGSYPVAAMVADRPAISTAPLAMAEPMVKGQFLS